MKTLHFASLLALTVASSFLFSSAKAGLFKADIDFKPEVALPVFKEKHPVVLFDQAHLNLAVTDGRYSPLIHLLESDGFQVKPVTTKITAAVLAGGDILYISGAQAATNEKVLGTTKSAFTEEEELLIQGWVKNGGSLLLMADHAPIGDAVHSLAAKFQVSVSDGETNDPQNYLPALQDTSHLLFTMENHLLMDHPIVHGQNKNEALHRVVAFSGQSVKGPSDSRPILGLSPTAENYLKNGGKSPVGTGYCEAVSFTYGKGRVVVFGDATVFTSKFHTVKNEKEGMNRTDIDNVKMATNTFRWLAEAQEK